MSAEPQAVVVLSTAPSPEVAAQVARELVDAELAACVNVVPGVRSIYRWQGKVHDEGELLLVIKTTPALQERLLEKLAQVHPYDVPEGLALPTQGGSPAYLRWIHEVTA
ncbi:MAG: divalent-cation tolerance protein CutA [Planctomycetes bacterium]|nr:divalent-cation tolerance protein CutA [Planctomycetota bacterium]